MLRTVRDLFRYNLEFALGAILILIVFGFAAASFFSPYPPLDSYVVPPDVPPSWAYPVRDQFARPGRALAADASPSAIRCCSACSVALMSRVPFAADRPGRRLCRRHHRPHADDASTTLLSSSPLFPILVLFFRDAYDNMSWPVLAIAMASLGCSPYDARLIRSVALQPPKSRIHVDERLFEA